MNLINILYQCTIIYTCIQWCVVMLINEYENVWVVISIDLRDNISWNVCVRYLYNDKVYKFKLIVYFQKLAYFKGEMIFVQPLFDNFLNNSLSHTHMCFLFSLLLSLSIVFVQSQEEKIGCHQSCLILVVQISLLILKREVLFEQPLLLTTCGTT